MRFPPASVTPLSSSDSTAPTISMRRSRIAWMTSLSTIAGATLRRRRRAKTPSSGTGRPNSVRSPTSRSRTLRMNASARCGGSLRKRFANSGPAGGRMMMVGGERLRVAVLARVDEPLLEAVEAWPVRDDRGVLVAGRHDHLLGQQVAGRGPQDPAVAVPVDALEPGAEAHLHPVARGVALQVADQLVARRKDRRTARVALARQLREGAARVEPQLVVATAPRRRDRVGLLQHRHRNATPSELRRRCESGRSGADHDYTLFAHTPTVGGSARAGCAIAHTS